MKFKLFITSSIFLSHALLAQSYPPGYSPAQNSNIERLQPVDLNNQQMPSIPMQQNGVPVVNNQQMPSVPMKQNGVPVVNNQQMPSVPMQQNGAPVVNNQQMPSVPMQQNGAPVDNSPDLSQYKVKEIAQSEDEPLKVLPDAPQVNPKKTIIKKDKNIDDVLNKIVQAKQKIDELKNQKKELSPADIKRMEMEKKKIEMQAQLEELRFKQSMEQQMEEISNNTIEGMHSRINYLISIVKRDMENVPKKIKLNIMYKINLGRDHMHGVNKSEYDKAVMEMYANKLYFNSYEKYYQMLIDIKKVKSINFLRDKITYVENALNNLNTQKEQVNQQIVSTVSQQKSMSLQQPQTATATTTGSKYDSYEIISLSDIKRNPLLKILKVTDRYIEIGF